MPASASNRLPHTRHPIPPRGRAHPENTRPHPTTAPGTLQLWNVSQQQPLRSLKIGGQGPAQNVAFFPGSSRALISFQDGTVG